MDSSGATSPGDRLVEQIIREVPHLGFYEVFAKAGGKARQRSVHRQCDPLDLLMMVTRELNVPNQAAEALRPVRRASSISGWTLRS